MWYLGVGVLVLLAISRWAHARRPSKDLIDQLSSKNKKVMRRPFSEIDESNLGVEQLQEINKYLFRRRIEFVSIAAFFIIFYLLRVLL